MALLKRTFYMLLIVISGLLYFLYAASMSISGDMQIHSSASWDRAKLPSSSTNHSNPEGKSSPSKTKRAAIEYRHSNDNKIEDRPDEKANGTQNVSSKTEVTDAVRERSNDNEKKGNPGEEVSNNKTQKIQSKTNKKPYIVEGIITRNLHDPGFILSSTGLCPDFGSKLQVFIIIASAPKNVDWRTAIRQTWGHYNQRSDVSIGFIIGRTSDNVEKAISQENELYNDMIQAKFIDSYKNLTLKSVSTLEWIDRYCYKSKFVFKTDDDMFINVPKLLSFISKHSNDTRTIFGRLCRKWKPNRNKSSTKYYTSVKEYNDTYLPDFVLGGGYLLTSDVIHEMYLTALDKKFFKLDDVYTTGMVADDRKIKRVNAVEFFNRRAELNPCNLQKYISIHKIKTYEQYDLWKMLLDGRSQC